MKARFCWFVLALMMVKSICAMEYVGARSGEMTFIWNESLLDELGLRAPHNTVGLEDNSTLRLRAEEGHLLGLADGYMALQEGLQLRNERDDLLATGLRLRAKGAGYFAAVITDSEGNEWFTLDHGHPLLDKSTSRLTWRYLDLRIGRDLAQRLGRRALRGQPIASVHIQIQLQNALSKPKALAACLNPVWPNPPQSYADVQLSDMAAVDYLRCIGCDGPGGSQGGSMVFAPSANLENVGETDVPWHTKYSGQFPPYNNDQHPILVWSMYRWNGDGTFEQIAKSGAKHAFATENAGCTCTDYQVLAPGCHDEYPSGSNDIPSNINPPPSTADGYGLGPRGDIVPRNAIWAACGSSYDPNCDGNPADFTRYDLYGYRSVLTERQIDPAQNPGARYFVDAWYLVRDEGNIYNNMGSREVFPQFGGIIWNFNNGLGPFVRGPTLDRWRPADSTNFANRTMSEARGRVQLVSSVRALAGGEYRYRYALLNQDFTTGVLGGVPNYPSVTNNVGISGFNIPLPSQAALLSSRVQDGDTNSANDWPSQRLSASLRFAQTQGNYLDWGTMMSFELLTDLAPIAGNLQVLTFNGENLQIVGLVPDASAIFSNDFE
jgi:hypothetical protein